MFITASVDIVLITQRYTEENKICIGTWAAIPGGTEHGGTPPLNNWTEGTLIGLSPKFVVIIIC